MKEDSDGLVLDIKTVGELTDAQIRRIDRAMELAGEDTWYADASKRDEVLSLVRQFDSPREVPWTSRAEQMRAAQQKVGGR